MVKQALARRWLPVAGLAALAALPPLALAAGEPYVLTLVTRILIYALAAVSLDLILGYGGMVSFGHAAFVGLGAYGVGILALHAQEGAPLLGWDGTIEALIAWPLAIAVTAVMALVIGALSLRTAGVYFIMITLAFAQMLYYLFLSLPGYGGDDGITLWGRNTLAGLPLDDDTLFYYLCLGALAGFVLLCRRVVGSRFGRVLQACRQNETRVDALGIPPTRYKLAAFVLAGAGAGLAGVLLANQAEFVSPAMMHWSRSGEILIMVILGGLGTLTGPVLGAFVLLLLEEVLAGWTEHWQVVLGPLLVLAVLAGRGGLARLGRRR